MPKLEGVDVERERVEFTLVQIIAQRGTHARFECVGFVEDAYVLAQGDCDGVKRRDAEGRRKK